jgi:hypothetical protein
MSAPDTNIEKQEKRHKPALMGIKGAIGFGVLMVLVLLFFVIGNGRDDETQPGLSSDTTVAPVDPVATGTNESN